MKHKKNDNNSSPVNENQPKRSPFRPNRVSFSYRNSSNAVIMTASPNQMEIKSGKKVAKTNWIPPKRNKATLKTRQNTKLRKSKKLSERKRANPSVPSKGYRNTGSKARGINESKPATRSTSKATQRNENEYLINTSMTKLQRTKRQQRKTKPNKSISLNQVNVSTAVSKRPLSSTSTSAVDDIEWPPSDLLPKHCNRAQVSQSDTAETFQQQIKTPLNRKLTAKPVKSFNQFKVSDSRPKRVRKLSSLITEQEIQKDLIDDAEETAKKRVSYNFEDLKVNDLPSVNEEFHISSAGTDQLQTESKFRFLKDTSFHSMLHNDNPLSNSTKDYSQKISARSYSLRNKNNIQRPWKSDVNSESQAKASSTCSYALRFRNNYDQSKEKTTFSDLFDSSVKDRIEKSPQKFGLEKMNSSPFHEIIPKENEQPTTLDLNYDSDSSTDIAPFLTRTSFQKSCNTSENDPYSRNEDCCYKNSIDAEIKALSVDRSLSPKDTSPQNDTNLQRIQSSAKQQRAFDEPLRNDDNMLLSNSNGNASQIIQNFRRWCDAKAKRKTVKRIRWKDEIMFSDGDFSCIHREKDKQEIPQVRQPIQESIESREALFIPDDDDDVDGIAERPSNTRKVIKTLHAIGKPKETTGLITSTAPDNNKIGVFKRKRAMLSDKIKKKYRNMERANSRSKVRFKNYKIRNYCETLDSSVNSDLNDYKGIIISKADKPNFADDLTFPSKPTGSISQSEDFYVNESKITPDVVREIGSSESNSKTQALRSRGNEPVSDSKKRLKTLQNDDSDNEIWHISSFSKDGKAILSEAPSSAPLTVPSNINYSSSVLKETQHIDPYVIDITLNDNTIFLSGERKKTQQSDEITTEINRGNGFLMEADPGSFREVFENKQISKPSRSNKGGFLCEMFDSPTSPEPTNKRTLRNTSSSYVNSVFEDENPFC